MSSMTQKEIIENLSATCGLSKSETKNFLDSLSELARKEVKENGEFALTNMGKVLKVERKARKGRNPATGEELQIPAKTTVRFRVGKAMKEAVT